MIFSYLQYKTTILVVQKSFVGATYCQWYQSMVPVSIVCCGGEITGVEIMWHWSMVGIWDGPGLSDKSGWQSDCG